VFSVETAAPEVVGDDDVSDGVEDELDVGGVGGARHVAVDLFGRRFVLGFKLRLDVSCCLTVVLRACDDGMRLISAADYQRHLWTAAGNTYRCTRGSKWSAGIF